MTALPKKLHYNGGIYDLHCEIDNAQTTLTYEHRPTKEDSYLIATCGNTIEKASANMLRYLKTEGIME